MNSLIRALNLRVTVENLAIKLKLKISCFHLFLFLFSLVSASKIAGLAKQ